MKGSTAFGRIAALVALGVAVVAVVLLLSDGDKPYQVTGEFESASQLVPGNEVIVGGVAAGSVKEIELGEDGQALVTFTVDDAYAPLRRGTVATVRSYSLSGVANRQVQLTIPPSSEGGEEIPFGGKLSQSETVSEVDLDEIFNTLDKQTVADFKRVIQGFDQSYAGVSEQANAGTKYANPFLSTSRGLFSELTYDERALERLIVDTSKLSGALAERSPDISALVGNLDQMMGAIGSRSWPSATRSRSSPSSCATPTPPSSTSAPRSMTSTPWSRPQSPPPKSCSRSWRACGSRSQTRCRRSRTSTRSSAARVRTTTSSSSPATRSASPARRSAPAPLTAAAATTSPTPPTAPVTATSPRAPSASPPAPSRTAPRPWRCSAPTRRSWSAGSTTSAPGHVRRPRRRRPHRHLLQPVLRLRRGVPNLGEPASPSEAFVQSDLDEKCPGAEERPLPSNLGEAATRSSRPVSTATPTTCWTQP